MTDGQRAIYEAAIAAGLSPNEAQTLAFPTRPRINAIGQTNTNGNYNMTGSSTYVNDTNHQTYVKSSATQNQNLHYIWKNNTGLSFEASASMDKYKNNPITPYASNPYIVTGSIKIPANVALFLTASWDITGSFETNISSSFDFRNYGISGSIVTGSIVRVSIPKAYFSEYVNDNTDTQQFKIWASNLTGSVGLEQFNIVSSSTTGEYVVLFASGSRATMGSVVTNEFMVSLGTTNLNNRTQ